MAMESADAQTRGIVAVPRMVYRHDCPLRSVPGSGYHHDSGHGRAPRGKCRGCGGMLVSTAGRYAVFVWRGDGRYGAATALATFTTERAAGDDAERRGAHTHTSRWVTAEEFARES